MWWKFIRTDPDKVEDVHNWPRKTFLTEVREFWGLYAYFDELPTLDVQMARPNK
jgi:hypothetical protein